VAAVILAGVVGLVAVLAAGETDRLREAARPTEAAIWAAGLSLYELHLLATMAGVARADLNAGTVEIVLREAGRFARDGIVVTGSGLPRERAAARVVVGEGLAGRALVTGHATLEGDGSAMVAPIVGAGGVAGVVTASAALDGPLFGAAQLMRLEGLAADIGRRLGASVGEPA
jgi:hypothetical protein